MDVPHEGPHDHSQAPPLPPGRGTCKPPFDGMRGCRHAVAKPCTAARRGSFCCETAAASDRASSGARKLPVSRKSDGQVSAWPCQPFRRQLTPTAAVAPKKPCRHHQHRDEFDTPGLKMRRAGATLRRPPTGLRSQPCLRGRLRSQRSCWGSGELPRHQQGPGASEPLSRYKPREYTRSAIAFV